MVKKRRNTTVYLKLQTGTVTLPHGFVTPEFTTPSRDLIIYFFFNINIDMYPYTNVMVRHIYRFRILCTTENLRKVYFVIFYFEDVSSLLSVLINSKYVFFMIMLA